MNTPNKLQTLFQRGESSNSSESSPRERRGSLVNPNRLAYATMLRYLLTRSQYSQLARFWGRTRVASQKTENHKKNHKTYVSTMSFYGLFSSVAARTWTSVASRACSPFSPMSMNTIFRGKHTLKTNKSVAKRFRVRGNGSLKRYVGCCVGCSCVLSNKQRKCVKRGPCVQPTLLLCQR